jgi:hypothetical protein
MSLERFLTGLRRYDDDDAKLQIISDNAVTPSSCLLASQPRFLSIGPIFRSDWNNQDYSKQRPKINRHHSEQIMAESFPDNSPKKLARRWAPTTPRPTDTLLVAPQRTLSEDIWNDESLHHVPLVLNVTMNEYVARTTGGCEKSRFRAEIDVAFETALMHA